VIETVFFAQPLEYAQHSIFEGLGRNGLVDGGLKSRLEDAGEVWNEQAGEKDRSDDSGGKALDEPVDLPGPALDAAEREEIRRGRQAPDPVILKTAVDAILGLTSATTALTTAPRCSELVKSPTTASVCGFK
jgi:hypothetical protein